MKAHLPVRRIVIRFTLSEKDDAVLLQLADACAFVLRFWAERKSGQYVDEYFDAFMGDDNRMPEVPDHPFFFGTWIFTA